ncbi:uncharacterized protein LOC143360595 [Halictus rubicundus]|uniref:uncharacterized protein LOC143360595 n=1 Tax=Halictus rubicundus TaxID=77578 RepID=UPI004036CBCA
MNETTGTSRSSERGSNEQKKPSHVRRLNFGQSILTLHVVRQFQGQRDGALTIDRNVSAIPCTSKGEFVRKWIETHRDLSSVTDTNEPAILSPVLGRSSDRGKVKSPVLCNQRKRVRRKDSPFRRANCPEERHGKRRSISENDRKENVRRNLFHSESADHVVQQSHVPMSPVLDGNPYKTGKKRFISERKALHRIENKRSDTGDNFPGGRAVLMNSPILDRDSSHWKRRRLRKTILPSEEKTGSPGSFICTQKRRALVQTLENCLKQMNESECVASDHSADSPISGGSKISGNSKASRQSRVHRDSKISEDSPDPQEKRPSIEESPRDARDLKGMDIEEVLEDNDDRHTFAEASTDDDVELSVRIEDADTQDTLPGPVNVARVQIDGSSSPCPVASSSTSSQTNNADSDRTYFSNAEQSGYSVARLSQKISQISSQLTLAQADKSAESGMIASVDSSQRMRTDPVMQFNLLDSTKKRRKKPKKGSLSEKLQALINRQVSFVRIWRHQVKQAAKDNVSLPCVTVHAQKCVSSFSRQFLEGVAIEDPFNLLPPREGIRYPRRIRIMTIPEIVGRIESKSASVVQIFPPWETLDDQELTLSVTYINVVTDDQIVIREDTKEESVRRSVVQEFDCSCIRTGKINLYCRDRYDKPNVMERLFNVEI